MKQFYKQRVSIVLCMLIVLILIANWEGENTNIPGLTPLNTAKARPDFYLNNVTTHQYGEDGKLNYLMIAESAVHQPAKNTTKLDKPKATFFSGHFPWYLTAEEGFMDKNGLLLVLKGKVFLYKDLRKRDNKTSKNFQLKTLLEQSVDQASMRQNSEAIKVNSHSLIIHTRNKIAMTSDEVVIHSPEGVTTAQGLGMQMIEGISKLSNNVRGTYNAK